ncbi:MAG: hypothetical protein ACLGHS_14925, partial [Actinomycetes bacterium]
ALHIAAARPDYLTRDEVSDDDLARERELAAKAAEGKPENVVEKIVEGKLNDFFKDRVLLDQIYIRDEAGATKGREPSSANFLSWWDGDPVRELLDGTRIDKYGTSSDTRLLTGADVHANNGTKATPVLTADLFGDWREELVFRNRSNTELMVFSTTIPTATRINTLMHDPHYRTQVAAQY